MLFFQGASPYTSLRLERKLKQLQIYCPNIQSLQANYWYFVDINELWSEKNESCLLQLLAPCEKKSPPQSKNFFIEWVIPRWGTISPWSSKATEIMHSCGLADINRVERGICYQLYGALPDNVYPDLQKKLASVLYDPLVESLTEHPEELASLFKPHIPQPSVTIDILELGEKALQIANDQLGLALNATEIEYLIKSFQRLKRNPTDVELMMFAQVNSEHCRHKIFNAHWKIDGVPSRKFSI